MKIYNYSLYTGEYVGESFADPDPLIPGSWLIPSGATTLKPPSTNAGYVACFLASEWSIKEDHRGTKYWLADGSEHEVDQIGVMPDGHLPSPQSHSPMTYVELRSLEYPPITDYIDGIVKSDQQQIDEYIAACLAVKAKYPKP